MPSAKVEPGSKLVVEIVRHASNRPALVSVEVSETNLAGEMSRAAHLMTPNEAAELVAALREALTRAAE